MSPPRGLHSLLSWLVVGLSLCALSADLSLQAEPASAVSNPNPKTPSSPALHQPLVSPTALRLAIDDLIRSHGSAYPQGAEFLARLSRLESSSTPQRIQPELIQLQREALLANPLLDFQDLLLVKRPATSPSLGLPRNWESICSLPTKGYDDELCLWSLKDASSTPRTVFKPGGRFIGDVDLHWDADRVLLSMPGTNGHWQVHELALTPHASPRVLTGEQPDVDSYDACYLPSGKIAFTSTAMFVGVPCVNGSAHVANLYIMEPSGHGIRQLCFDQEHNWCPTVMNDGRLLYARWEYTDTPHSNSRLLFTCNPDGTSQLAFLGSGSYWPNSFFYARPIPNHPSKVVAVIGGHHDHPRMGELVIFDPQRGRSEGQPVVQRIPGFQKKVDPLIRDGLTLESWPKFLHPWPLSENQFIVSCKLSPSAPWGIYLADVFDNLLPLHQLADYALLEPIPLRKTTRPPIIPERVNPARTDAVVLVQDVYTGEGMHDVPRGTIKSLRLFTYHYAYRDMGGLLGVVGMDGPWDIKRVLGTVPVESDGSARFRVPANTPISIQPLDAEGKAVQLMRSWMTAMPGENVQCAGCHDRPNAAPPAHSLIALTKEPAIVTPWHGPVRGFSYPREVQPVIDQHCLPCHNGSRNVDGSQPIDLRGSVKLADWSSVTPGNGGYAKTAGKFSVGYANLHRFVRRPGIESDFHVLEPMEFHADTTHLVQMLKKGHHGVQLDTESWDRLITWIDLNCPFHGTWGEEIANPGPQRERRRALLQRYANLDDDPESIPTAPPSARPVTPVLPSHRSAFPTTPTPLSTSNPPFNPPGWPFSTDTAKRLQTAAHASPHRQIEVAPGLTIDLVVIPAGEFLMGSSEGAPDEQPLNPVRIERPFWMSRFEVNNALFTSFNPSHDSRVEDKNTYQFGIHGYPANAPDQPVVRVSWDEAMAFCRWLSDRTHLRFTLPTEAQWEWACRAGSASPFHFGALHSDFSRYANFADAKLREFASDPYTVDKPLPDATPYDDWIPKDARFNDGALIAIAPGRYLPNDWGLHEMHGNVAEWTRSSYAPYPYASDTPDTPPTRSPKVVRGGSWRDVPNRATASFRLSYQTGQRVYNVGFRVVCEGDAKDTASLRNQPSGSGTKITSTH